MKAEEALDKIESLAYSYDKGKIESMREGIKQILEQYAAEAEKRGIERGTVIGEHGCESMNEQDIIENQYKDWILKHYGYSDRSFEVSDSSYMKILILNYHLKNRRNSNESRKIKTSKRNI